MGRLGGESAAGMMCCGVAGKKCRRRERRPGRGRREWRRLPVWFCLFYSVGEKEHISCSSVDKSHT